MKRPIRQTGLGLIELMVAILIGLIVTAAAASIWVTNKKTYVLQEDLGRIQENARFALTFLQYDARMAGYFGCTQDAPHVPTGFDSDVSMSDDTLGYPVKSDGSQLKLYYFSAQYVSVIGYPDEGDTSLTLRNSLSAIGYGPGDIIGIGNCGAAEILATDDIDSGGTELDLASPVQVNYESVAGVVHAYLLHSAVYSVGTNTKGRAILYRDGGELVEGIEAWELLFGEDTGGTSAAPDSYVSANSVANWDYVRAIRAALLASSTEQYGPEKDQRSYTLLDTTFDDPNDEARRRRAFRTTLMTRNLQQ